MVISDVGSSKTRDLVEHGAFGEKIKGYSIRLGLILCSTSLVLISARILYLYTERTWVDLVCALVFWAVVFLTSRRRISGRRQKMEGVVTDKFWVVIIAALCLVFGLAKTLRPHIFLAPRQRYSWRNFFDIYSSIFKSAYGKQAVRINGCLLLAIGIGLMAWVIYQ